MAPPVRSRVTVPTATTSRYAARFHCIGTACEDNCCAHAWRVSVDKPDYARLKRALAGSPAQREQFERGCVRGPDGGADQPYATLQKTPAGQCVFLAPDRLCSIHAAHGPAALPSVCATYPRILSEIGRHLSLTDTLSCPEAARLCLLAEDAVQIDDADPLAMRAFKVRHSLPATSRDPMVRNFLVVRRAFLNLLAMNEYPMASRFAFAANLARRLDATRTAHGGSAQDARIRDAMSASASARSLAAQDRACASARVSGTLPFVLVQQLLIAVRRMQAAPRFDALVDAVYAPFLDPQAGGPGAAGEAAPTLRGGELWEAYRVRRGRWERTFPDRIAQFVGNYAANYWMRDPFTASLDLRTHVLQLLARVAVIRFLLFNHPTLQGPGDGDPKALREALDRAAVDVVYAFSRAVEHADAVGDLLRGVLARHRVRGIRQVPELARF